MWSVQRAFFTCHMPFCLESLDYSLLSLHFPFASNCSSFVQRLSVSNRQRLVLTWPRCTQGLCDCFFLPEFIRGKQDLVFFPFFFSCYLPLPHSTPQNSDEAEFFPCVNHATPENVFIGKPCSLGHLVTDGPCRATGLSHQSCPRDRDCVYHNRWAQATSKHLINLDKD